MAFPLRLVNETPSNTFLVDVSPAFGGDVQKMVNCFKADIGHDMGDQFTDNLRNDFKNNVSNFSDSVGKEMVLRYVGLQHNDLHKTSSKTVNPSRIGTPDMDDGKKALRTILRGMSGPLLGKTFSERNTTNWNDVQRQIFAKHILLLITAIHLDGDGNSINEILDIFFDAEVIPFAELYAFCRDNVDSHSPISLAFNVYYDEKNPITVERVIKFYPSSSSPFVFTRVFIGKRLLFETPELSIDSTDTRFASSVTTLTTIARTYYTIQSTGTGVNMQKVVKDNYVKRAGKTLGKVSPGMLTYITETVNSALGQSTSKEDVLKGCCAIKTSCDSTKAVLTESLQAVLTAFGKSDTAISFFTGDILAFSIFGYTLGGSGSTAISSYDPRPQDASPGTLESFTLTRGGGGGQVVFNNVPLTGGASFTIDEGTIAEQGKDFGFTEGIVTGLLPTETGAGSGDADMGSTVIDSNKMKLFSILKQLRLENRGNPIYKTDGTPNKIFYAWVIQLLKTATQEQLTPLFGGDYLGALVKLMEFPFPLGDTFRSFADVPISVARNNIINTVLFTMALGLFEFHKISPPEDDTQKNTLDYITTLVYVYLYNVFFMKDKSIADKLSYLAPFMDTYQRIYGPDPSLGKVTLLSSDKYNQFYTTIGTSNGTRGFGEIVIAPKVGSSRIRSVAPTTILAKPPTLTGKGILKFSNIATASAQGVLLMSVLGKDFSSIYTKLNSIFTSNQLTTLY
jgi:hypothetical protein